VQNNNIPLTPGAQKWLEESGSKFKSTFVLANDIYVAANDTSDITENFAKKDSQIAAGGNRLANALTTPAAGGNAAETVLPLNLSTNAQHANSPEQNDSVHNDQASDISETEPEPENNSFTSEDILNLNTDDERLKELDKNNAAQVNTVQHVNDYMLATVDQIKKLVRILVNSGGQMCTTDVFDYMAEGAKCPVKFEAAVKQHGVCLADTLRSVLKFIGSKCEKVLKKRHKEFHRIVACDFVLNIYFSDIGLPKDFGSL
jgi:hypothetical protein